MKCLALAFLLITLAIAAVARRTCENGDDCGEDECCIDGGLFTPGRCRSLAKENKLCRFEDEANVNGRYNRYCPCEAGLDCETGEQRIQFGKVVTQERCTISSRETTKTEVSETEAEVSETEAEVSVTETEASAEE